MRALLYKRSSSANTSYKARVMTSRNVIQLGIWKKKYFGPMTTETEQVFQVELVFILNGKADRQSEYLISGNEHTREEHSMSKAFVSVTLEA